VVMDQGEGENGTGELERLGVPVVLVGQRKRYGMLSGVEGMLWSEAKVECARSEAAA